MGLKYFPLNFTSIFSPFFSFPLCGKILIPILWLGILDKEKETLPGPTQCLRRSYRTHNQGFSLSLALSPPFVPQLITVGKIGFPEQNFVWILGKNKSKKWDSSDSGQSIQWLREYTVESGRPRLTSQLYQLLMCDFGQITYPLWILVSSSVEWGCKAYRMWLRLNNSQSA